MFLPFSKKTENKLLPGSLSSSTKYLQTILVKTALLDFQLCPCTLKLCTSQFCLFAISWLKGQDLLIAMSKHQQSQYLCRQHSVEAPSVLQKSSSRRRCSYHMSTSQEARHVEKLNLTWTQLTPSAKCANWLVPPVNRISEASICVWK